MFVFYYNTSCDQNESAPTSTPPSKTASVVLVISSFSLLTNALALLVLARREVRRNFGNLRVNLTLLSATEVGLNFFMLFDSSLDLLNLPYTVPTLVMASVAYLNINALLCIRNWCVALIASSRCEAIIRPIGARRRNYCQPTKVKFYFIFIVFLSYCLSLGRVFKKYGVVCPPHGRVHIESYMAKFEVYRHFEHYGYFIYQSVFPISIVLVATAAMIFMLVCKSTLRGLQASGNRHQTLKATRTILFLAALFIILEFPIFVITSLQMSRLISPDLVKHFVWIFKAFAAIDSSCNFFVYVFTNDRFKRAFLHMLFDLRHCDRESRRQYRLSQRHMTGPAIKYCAGQCSHGTLVVTDSFNYRSN